MSGCCVSSKLAKQQNWNWFPNHQLNKGRAASTADQNLKRPAPYLDKSLRLAAFNEENWEMVTAMIVDSIGMPSTIKVSFSSNWMPEVRAV